jgi:hypothetical protein
MNCGNLGKIGVSQMDCGPFHRLSGFSVQDDERNMNICVANAQCDCVVRKQQANDEPQEHRSSQDACCRRLLLHHPYREQCT